MKCDEINELLSGYIDGELTQAKRQQVDLHLPECADCSRVVAELSALRERIGALPMHEMSSEEWRKKMNDGTVRATRGIGWVLLIAGFSVGTAYGIYEFAFDPEVDPIARFSTAAIWAGLLGLFLSVLRQRLIARKTDRYNDVEI